MLSETRSESSTQRIAIHPAYQQIIGLGQPAVPLLLREVEKRSGRWFWALKSITREAPVSVGDRGKTKKMIAAWLVMGEAKGLSMVGNSAWNSYEKEHLEQQFPHLASEGYTITSPDTIDYNCVAWAAASDEEWWWPDSMEQEYWPEGVPREE